MHASSLELDALSEMANVGMCRAATQLSALLDDVIDVSVPEVKIAPISEFMQASGVDEKDRAAIVTQSVSGYVNGSALLMFHDEDSRALVNALIGTVPTLAGLDMRCYEHEAMTEIGNIIISSAVAVMADMMGNEIRLGVPVFSEESMTNVLNHHAVDEMGNDLHVIMMTSTLTAARRDVQGTLMFMLGVDSVKDLLQKIKDFLASHDAA